MLSYIYIIFLVCVLLYSIYRDISIYRKGEYKSYPFLKEEKRNVFFHIFVIVTLLGCLFFVADDKFPILLTTLYIFAPIIFVQTITFNYLIYKKTKDKKIIFNTIIYILIATVVFRAILK